MEGVSVISAADARLIAAAPDLLEGLLELLDYHVDTYAAQKALAAIAKATGEPK